MRTPSRVIVGVDTSPESLAALEWALVLGAGLEGRLFVVHAVGLLEEGGFRQRPDLAAIVDSARGNVVEAAEVPVEIVEEDGSPAEVIVRVADRCEADLIVVGSRGLGQAPRLLGSVSEGVLAHAHVAVLIVPHNP